ncbi:MAG: glycine cleavage system protein GcvH [Verrucomicrobiota bacterium]|nr:glycine cleavage system protein H [Kiritimatiellaceae bacterium]MEC7108192.1 glycine cleavage system protein GcvH [Verrucomicrobiota bacterium]MEC8517548.1 glycine cleavage system protein GcvH [Verrucomicrobiota bacterium]MEC8753651.1 glycine cleavage system protein GcvH [Verrucomicrobiota bacterium]
MALPQELFYTKSHEWISFENGIATIGITDFAQHQLSDLTFVELPDSGQTVSSGDEVAVVESVKAAADVYAPISGDIVEVNNALEDDPEIVNRDAFGEGWIFKINVKNESELDELMDADSYQEICPES